MSKAIQEEIMVLKFYIFKQQMLRNLKKYKEKFTKKKFLHLIFTTLKTKKFVEIYRKIYEDIALLKFTFSKSKR